jgi:hypothetical protein
MLKNLSVLLSAVITTDTCNTFNLHISAHLQQLEETLAVQELIIHVTDNLQRATSRGKFLV